MNETDNVSKRVIYTMEQINAIVANLDNLQIKGVQSAKALVNITQIIDSGAVEQIQTEQSK